MVKSTLIIRIGKRNDTGEIKNLTRKEYDDFMINLCTEINAMNNRQYGYALEVSTGVNPKWEKSQKSQKNIFMTEN